ncbi:RNA-binding cell elongation regulator Jag/EloR [Butyrivibrio sp. YAB3001]|uniref:RNA-binding cell elongation regulator Jag/EloR n=1 Tax=Butyrivibrio sp. YAB3001 TaxID=1520812 RepID=UPI0008F65A93|nr:RNA-binding cell elongation regulator Jag/EloR [Butyrivibrio sp. YAB3001]SFC85194.1 spoIIIJ-associated protein [Butyrivibrio sp. YAB3001]
MDFKEFTAKNVDEAITEACEDFMVTSDRLEYEVISNGSTGFLGINSKPAVIKARVKEDAVEKNTVDNTSSNTFASSDIKVEKKTTESVVTTKAESNVVDGNVFVERANDFLKDVFGAMNMEVSVNTKFNSNDNILDVELSGAEMGVLIGKRGQTLDSLQYLISLVVNRDSENYIHVKVDTENYRERRKATLENLAKNISYKVRKTRQSVALEPMNPYERRIIHSALQNDRYVTTHSEGDEPFRRVVVTLKK